MNDILKFSKSKLLKIIFIIIILSAIILISGKTFAASVTTKNNSSLYKYSESSKNFIKLGVYINSNKTITQSNTGTAKYYKKLEFNVYLHKTCVDQNTKKVANNSEGYAYLRTSTTFSGTSNILGKISNGTSINCYNISISKTYSNYYSLKIIAWILKDDIKATATAKTYTLTYSANSGKGGPSTQSFKSTDTTIKISASKPTLTGYTFQGWSSNRNATTASYKAGQTIENKWTSDKTLYAVWKKNTAKKITVTYNSNGGTGTLPATTEVVVGSTIRMPRANLTRSGYKFIGWSSNKNSTNPLKVGGQYPVNWTANTTVYAIWEKNAAAAKTYTLTYSANGGSGVPKSQSFKSTDKNIKLSTTIPELTNYTFLGWSLNKNATVASYKAEQTIENKWTSNKTLYAVWKQGKIKITKLDFSKITIYRQYYVKKGTSLELPYGDNFYYNTNEIYNSSGNIISNKGISKTNYFNSNNFSTGTYYICHYSTAKIFPKHQYYCITVVDNTLADYLSIDLKNSPFSTNKFYGVKGNTAKISTSVVLDKFKKLCPNETISLIPSTSSLNITLDTNNNIKISNNINKDQTITIKIIIKITNTKYKIKTVSTLNYSKNFTLYKPLAASNSTLFFLKDKEANESMSMQKNTEIISTIYNSNGEKLTNTYLKFSSSNTSFATVNSSGIIKAKAVGKATITVSWGTTISR